MNARLRADDLLGVTLAAVRRARARSGMDACLLGTLAVTRSCGRMLPHGAARRAVR